MADCRNALGRALVATTLLAASAAAQDGTSGPLTIERPWSRATAGAARTAAVYMTVRNDGSAPDHLIGAETAIADSAEIHHTRATDSGVMQMRPVSSVEVPAGQSVELNPGANLHIMLTGTRHPLRAGDRLPLTLIFERAGRIMVEVAVDKAGASGPTHTGHAK